ncbi:MAG: hypothetical protein PVH29_02185 [Candidatus Zixiibacteriota bacterium]|jgi:ligand-binding sensor domain-containing protein
MKRFLYLLLFCALAATAAAEADTARWHNVVPRTRVSDILIDGDAIWLTYLGGGAARYEPETGRAAYYTAADGLVHNYATAVTAVEDEVYFGTRNGLSTLTRTSGTFTSTIRMWGFAHNDITDVAGADEYLYVATIEGARCYDKSFGNKEFTPVPKEQGPASRLSPQVEDGWKVFASADGVVLDDLYSVTVDGGTVYWGGRGRVLASGPGAVDWREVPVELPEMAVVRRVLPRDGKLILATDAGAFEFDGTATRPVDGPPGRADTRDALAFAGLEYFATAEGLFVRRSDGEPFKFAAGAGAAWTKLKDARKKESPWWRLGPGDGLPSPACTALASRGESLVVGTENGACLLEPASGEVRVLPLGRGLPAGGVYGLAYGDGAIYVGTAGGLAELDAADYTARRYSLPVGWNDVRDVRYDGGELLVTTRAGFAAAGRVGDGVRYFERPKGTPADVEGTCATKLGGRYFIGTTTGLLELDADLRPVGFYGKGQGFPSYPIRALLPHGPGILVATAGGGLINYNETGGAEAVTEGISSDIIFSLAADEGHVYVGTFDKGVDILDEELAFERNITWGDGLSHTDIWAEAVVGPWLWLSIRGVGINAFNLETGDVRRYYARYGLGDEYCKSIIVLPTEGPGVKLAFGTASGVAILEYEGEPPDYAADDYDGSYP